MSCVQGHGQDRAIQSLDQSRISASALISPHASSHQHACSCCSRLKNSFLACRVKTRTEQFSHWIRAGCLQALGLPPTRRLINMPAAWTQELIACMQGQDQDRAVRSLDQSGVSTSAQMVLNIKSDLGSPEKGSLHAQCALDAANSQAALQKVCSVGLAAWLWLKACSAIVACGLTS